MLMIRFQRIGRTNDPAFRISVLEKERAAKAGNIVEQLGTYNPKSKEFTINEEAVKSWIAKGAQPTDSIRNLLINKGILEGKKVNVLPKKTPQKKDEPEGAAAPAAPVAESAPVEAPAEETPAEVEAPSEAEVAAEAEPAAEEEKKEEAAPEAVEETPAA